MHSPGLTLWRLSESGERCLGPSCNADGLFLGRTSLLECQGNEYVVRDQRELERVMSAAYGCDVALTSRMGGFRAVAKALNAGDLCRATIAAVMLRLPDLPDYAARQKLEAENWLVKAEHAAWAKIVPVFNPEKHPRWPGGRTDGGRFRPVNDNGDVSPSAVEKPPGPGHNGGPPLEPPPEIPPEEPPKAVRNAFLRRMAAWLAEAGEEAAEVPEVAAVLEALAAVAWMASHIGSVISYSDAPEDLSTLQDAVRQPRPGTEVHHIVETQYESDRPDANAKVFKDGRLESRENKVRIPYWKHREISEWYSHTNEDLGGQTPRDYLRSKSWIEQYKFGLDVLRKFGVLK